MANKILTPEVAAVLSRATITGNKLVVPNNPDGTRLDRALYTKVNDALVAAGGKWNTREQGHIFPSDPRPKLGLMLETGVAVDEAGNKKKKLQAFYTPKPLADEIAQLANVKGQFVLEPSAGRGALVEACARAGARGVVCVELDPESAEQLKADGLTNVTCADFLTLQPNRKYSRIVMNPPFTRGQDIKHVEHALKWLAPDGVLVSVMLADGDRPKLKEVLNGHDWKLRDVPAGAFKESGTNIATAILTVRTEKRVAQGANAKLSV